VEIGLYFDLRDPPPWRRGWGRVFDQAMEIAEEADRRGGGSIWLSEHHLFEDGYLPQPLVFAAAVAARTKRVRIGTAVLLAPLRPALTIAEEAAVVDVLSGGRLELGLGTGYRVPEYEAFGATPARRLDQLAARVEEIRELWASPEVTPQPAQADAPIWLGAHGPRSARIAGKLGTGLLSLNPDLWEHYLEGLEQGGHAADTARASGPMAAVIASDPERTREILQPHSDYVWGTYQTYANEGLERSGKSFPQPPMFRQGGKPPVAVVLDPDEAISRLRAIGERLPIAQAFFWASVGGMPDELVEEHVDLLLGRVAPALAADAPGA
jgi:alkanesulfonate monooxygenase SsuD/methylene tetrahydromethanopterin reductase-like flavin-dependent oxidoreductase (luciferase family)